MDIIRAFAGLADAARTGRPELTAYDYVPDAVEAPAFYPADVDINYLPDFSGDGDLTVVCRVLTSRTEDRAGQHQLLRYMQPAGPWSIKQALEVARGAPGEYALGGACDDFVVQSLRGHRIYTVGSTPYYGAEWRVRLIGDGDGNAT